MNLKGGFYSNGHWAFDDPYVDDAYRLVGLFALVARDKLALGLRAVADKIEVKPR